MNRLAFSGESGIGNLVFCSVYYNFLFQSPFSSSLRNRSPSSYFTGVWIPCMLWKYIWVCIPGLLGRNRYEQ